MRSFNPMDHYWLRQNGTVYSSSAQADLPVNAPAYRAFLDVGGYPTRYPQDANGAESPEELAAVLSNYGLQAYAPLGAVAPEAVQTATAQATGAVIEAAVAPLMSNYEQPCTVAAHSEQPAEAKVCAADNAAPPAPAIPVTGLAGNGSGFDAASVPFMAAEQLLLAAACSEQSAETEPRSADNTPSTPLPDCLAAALCIKKDTLAQRLKVKGDLYKRMSGLLLEQQQTIMADARLSDSEKITALEQLDSAAEQLKQSTGI